MIDGNIIKSVLDALRSPWLIFSVGVMLIIVYVIPKEYFGEDLALYVSAHKGWVLLGSIICIVLSVVLGVQSVLKKAGDVIRSRHNRKLRNEQVIEDLSSLSADEESIFLWCLKGNQRSFNARLHEPVVDGLIGKGLVVNNGGNVFSCTYTIRREVWRYICENGDEVFPDYNSYTQEEWISIDRYMSRLVGY